MFGFGNSKKKVEKRLTEVQKKIDPAQDSSRMSIEQINAMGMAAMSYDSINNEYASSKKSKRDRKSTLSALKSVEKDVRKATKR
jgi:hypothetical protein